MGRRRKKTETGDSRTPPVVTCRDLRAKQDMKDTKPAVSRAEAPDGISGGWD